MRCCRGSRMRRSRCRSRRSERRRGGARSRDIGRPDRGSGRTDLESVCPVLGSVRPVLGSVRPGPAGRTGRTGVGAFYPRVLDGAIRDRSVLDPMTEPTDRRSWTFRTGGRNVPISDRPVQDRGPRRSDPRYRTGRTGDRDVPISDREGPKGESERTDAAPLGCGPATGGRLARRTRRRWMPESRRQRRRGDRRPKG
jgi:hypothetical protein